MGFFDNITLPPLLIWIVGGVLGLIAVAIIITVFFSESTTPLGNFGRNLNRFFTKTLEGLGPIVGKFAASIIGRLLFYIALIVTLFYSIDFFVFNGTMTAAILSLFT